MADARGATFAETRDRPFAAAKDEVKLKSSSWWLPWSPSLGARQ